MNHLTQYASLPLFAVLSIAMISVSNSDALAAGGILNLTVHDEDSGAPTTTRAEIVRVDKPDKPMPIRKTVPAGMGIVLDRALELSVPDGAYIFRMIRGPEYRIITGNFTLERSSLDDHNVDLPRMIDMQSKGWTSGDCCVVTSPYSLPLRMVAEDLHVAAALGHVDAKPIAGRDRDDPPTIDPMWIREDAKHRDGLVFYGIDPASSDSPDETNREAMDVSTYDPSIKIAIENPFAWPLPIWLASDRIDGLFVMGDWLRLDRKVLSVKDGRETTGLIKGTTQAVGRWAERIYWNTLEAGFRIPPMAGSGNESGASPVGYNRLYVTAPIGSYRNDGSAETAREGNSVANEDAWWRAAWNGQSVATNGPMLRPMLGGEIPGHVFTATQGEALQLQPEVDLSTRDPVDYLEVVHNGQVHYKAKLDEFARAGGVIPPLVVRESGWVVMRVVTLFDDHYRFATSAPWHIEFDGHRRVTSEAVQFFQLWQNEYEERLKKLPPDELTQYIPQVKTAREFWSQRSSEAVDATGMRP
ncbi:hypothetical protein [Rubripirellula tenax]|uniref:hypothetical protein n=1 Tax=Rubripirellula tenax TaxID=2528015 RepID=UPI0011B53343|nr:hypothetical protein [Rubripirellula tenax]